MVDVLWPEQVSHLGGVPPRLNPQMRYLPGMLIGWCNASFEAIVVDGGFALVAPLHSVARRCWDDLDI